MRDKNGIIIILESKKGFLDKFTFLKERESALKSKLGEIEWFEADTACGVAVNLNVENVFDSSKFDEYSEWCYQKVLLFKEVVVPYVKEYRQQL
jgi:hypothetical protein